MIGNEMRDSKWSALNPTNESYKQDTISLMSVGRILKELTKSEIMATTMIPTFQLMESLASDSACPPRMTVRDMKPIKLRQFNRPKTTAG